MKKGKHKYSCGDIVTFKFFDGGVYTGKITEQTYQGDNVESIKTNFDMPTYKIQVEDLGKSNNKRGFTIYPCMSETRIVSRDKTALRAMKDFELDYRDKINKARNSSKTEDKSELDIAIESQKKFLDNNIEDR